MQAWASSLLQTVRNTCIAAVLLEAARMKVHHNPIAVQS